MKKAILTITALTLSLSIHATEWSNHKRTEVLHECNSPFNSDLKSIKLIKKQTKFDTNSSKTAGTLEIKNYYKNGKITTGYRKTYEMGGADLRIFTNGLIIEVNESCN